MISIQALVRKCILKGRVYKTRFLPFRTYRIRTGFGFRIILDIRKDVDRLFYLGLFENEMLHFFAKVVSKGSTVFDVGANIGIYSLLASKRTGADGHVYSFEPSDWAFQRLNENISMNEFKNISVFKVGVSDKKGTASFHVCEDDAYNSIGSTPMQEVKSVKQIDICSIDDICTANNIKRIDIIKIDTEGADLLVLQGARGMLNSADPPIVFCEYNKNITSGYAYSLEDYRNYISGIGYKAFEFKNNMLVEFDPAQSASSEIVCIKKEQVSYYSALAKETKCENCSI